MRFVRAALVIGLGLTGAGPLAAEEASFCGMKPDMVELLIEQQKPEYIAAWRDGKMFVNQRTSDGSLWGVSMKNTTVHPSAVCRRKVGEGDKATVETGLLCTASEKACQHFAEQVNARMDKIEKGER